MDFLDVNALLAAGSALGAVAVALRSLASARLEREARERVEAVARADQETAMRQAYEHTRNDLQHAQSQLDAARVALNDARELYTATAISEQSCREELEELREELRLQDLRCERQLGAMRAEMGELRRAIESQGDR